MKKEYLLNLLAGFIVCVVIFGVVEYANNLKYRIKEKQETLELKKEKLRLEIAIKKKQLNYISQ